MKPFHAFAALMLIVGDGSCRALEDNGVSQLIINHRDFADALTAELYSAENECSSAWGVSMAFSLIYPGTISPSTEQMRNALGYPTSSLVTCPDPDSFGINCFAYVDQCQTDSNCTNGQVCCLIAGCGKECMPPQLPLVWNDTATRMSTAYNGTCVRSSFDGDCMVQEPTLEIANSVWLDDDDALSWTYAAIVESFARQIDFQEDGAAGTINAWVNETTKGLIDSILPEGTIEAALIAVNSIYLKASWLTPFPESFTNEDTFYSSSTRITAVDAKALFMHIFDYFSYSHDALPGFQLAQLPFVGDLAMVFVLPLSDASGSVTSGAVLEAAQQMEQTQLALAIPKFKFESEYNEALKEAVQVLGITAPFSPGTLCLLENDCSLFIDEIIQKTVIDVNEKGVEAAAVTVIPIARNIPPVEESAPILFLADHPFQFFIFDVNEQLVIFEGRVGDPGIPDNAEPAQLQSSHADSDFWSANFGIEPILPDLATAPTEGPVAAPPTQGTTPANNDPSTEIPSEVPTGTPSFPSDEPTEIPVKRLTETPSTATDEPMSNPTDTPTVTPSTSTEEPVESPVDVNALTGTGTSSTIDRAVLLWIPMMVLAYVRL